MSWLQHAFEDFGITSAYGYPGYLASQLFEAGETELALNERTAVHRAHMASYLGERSLCFFKNAGLNAACLPVFNSVRAGCRAGMVIIVTDDLQVSGSEFYQDSEALCNVINAPFYDPNPTDDLYEVLREAVQESEATRTPGIIRLHNDHFETKQEAWNRRSLEQRSFSNPARLILHPGTFEDRKSDWQDRMRQRDDAEAGALPGDDSSAVTQDKSYDAVFDAVSDKSFLVVTGGFGTYTLAEGTPITYALTYSGGAASAAEAAKIEGRACAILGGGAVTHDSHPLQVLSRVDDPVKVVVIRNDGISDKTPLPGDVDSFIPRSVSYDWYPPQRRAIREGLETDGSHVLVVDYRES